MWSDVFTVYRSIPLLVMFVFLSWAKSEYRNEVKAMKQNKSLALSRYFWFSGNSKSKNFISSSNVR